MTPERAAAMRRAAYVALLVAFAGAAAVHLGVRGLQHLFFALGGRAPLYLLAACPVPLLCIFDDPAGHLLGMLSLETLLDGYRLRYGDLLVAAALLALGVRRALGWRRQGAVEAPASFAGFPFGLAILGLGLVVFGELGGWRFTFPVMKDPRGVGAALAFVAFLLAELWPRGTAGRDEAASGAPQASRRRPVWTIAACVLPLAMAALGFAFASQVSGLGAVGVALVSIWAGTALGAAAVLVAIVRRERWVALQVFAFLLNFGIGAISLGMGRS